MIVKWARQGTHTALAVFRLARETPCLQHAVRTAPRAWWQDVVASVGSEYWALRTTKAFSGEICRMRYNVPAWEIIVRAKGGASEDYYTRRFMEEMRMNGAESFLLPLCFPHDVFSTAAREWGLNCIACGEVEKHDKWAGLALCSKCQRRAKRFKSEAHFAIHLIDTKAREMARAERKEIAA